MRTIAADPKHLGAETGFFAVLHTWGQTLVHHPHLHVVVAGGGPSFDGTRWISSRPDFFLSVRVLSRLFRRLFLKYLEAAFDAGDLQFFSSLEPLRIKHTFLRHLAPLRKAKWVVYAKAPFDGPQAVLRYVAQYTHRVAISNNRLLGLDDGKVQFRWKDYRDNNQHKTMELAADEFPSRWGCCHPHTGSLEAVARLQFPQNVACGFPALRSSAGVSQHCFFRCYLFKFRFHGQLIFSLNRRPCLPLNGAHVAQEQFTCR